MTKKEINQLKASLKEVCLSYSDFKDAKRRKAFGLRMYERLWPNINNTLYDKKIIYEAAQWGGKYGNFCRAIFYYNNAFHFGCGFSHKQIFEYI